MRGSAGRVFLCRYLNGKGKLTDPLRPLLLCGECKQFNALLNNFYNEKLPVAEIDLVIESSVPYEKLKLKRSHTTILGTPIKARIAIKLFSIGHFYLKMIKYF